MRLLITADLHYNHPKSRPVADDLIDRMNAAGGDAVVVVGDTAVADGDALERCLSRFTCPGPKLVVAGNHELWTHGPDSHAVFTADLKDLAAVRRTVALSRRMGFTGLMTFYPPHVPIINEIMSPTEAEVDWAARAVQAYEEGQANGLAALTLDGKWLTVHQYTGAKSTLQLASSIAAGQATRRS